jgi:DNA-binding transcriptional ArsR family regulator
MSPAPVFAALGDETRLFLIDRLCTRGAQSIAHLTSGSNMTRQAITKHLNALSNAGIVRSERAGRERVWSVETARLAEARGYLYRVSVKWDAAIERLREFVESDDQP